MAGVMDQRVIVVGSGLAGSEAAWQIASRGIAVRLYEMRPAVQTGAHATDHLAGALYNMVGFQTNLRSPEQRRVLRMIRGLEGVHFVRYGQMHRNTFINAPRLLRPTLQAKDAEDLLFTGQITGVEGDLGNIATGLLADLNAARVARGRPPLSLPADTMLGALCHYIAHAEAREFQPMKANFGILPRLRDVRGKGKRGRARAYAARAAASLRSSQSGHIDSLRIVT